MLPPKAEPIESLEALRWRIERLIVRGHAPGTATKRGTRGFTAAERPEAAVDHPAKSLLSFLSFLVDALPDGDIYLFGGVLRDIALFGKRGFNSDIDLVVEGSWDNCLPYLHRLGATRNKFGGYRLDVAGWPIDVWKAEETWAIRERLVPYHGIASLIQTTVLNWDAILMNWRTRQFICSSTYIEQIQTRLLDVVLAANPNPLGTIVRVLRHLCLKDAKQITRSAADYIGSALNEFDFERIKTQELMSYGNTFIEAPIYKLFKYYGNAVGVDAKSRLGIASNHLQKELGLTSLPDTT